MSGRAWDAVVTAAAGLGILLVVRLVLGFVFERVVQRASERKPADYVARLRTRLMVLRRVVVAFVFVIVVWSVLEIFPATEQFARALLASSAVLALFVGVAFSVPLGNIGAGILLSLTQPIRIGDRLTVGNVTGVAEEIALIHTVVRTDDGRTAFVPNSQMVTSTVVNRSLDDPRRLVTVRLPIPLTSSVDAARDVLLAVAREGGVVHLDGASVVVAEVGERTIWLTLSGHADSGTKVEAVAAELRERGLAALRSEGLLPTE
jgi:small-conductance mechanosensitive channel